MRYFASLLCVLALSVLSLAQTQNLQYYRISNLTSAYPYVDNRSQATRYADYYGFCATGTGTWSVTIQYSDVSISGPWSSFSVGGLTVTNASTSCYGFASGYHAFLRFNITGTASVDFTGSRGFYYPGQSATGGGGGGDVSSVFGRTGAVTAQTGDYNITQITNGVNATTAYPNPAFVATLDWSKLINIPSYQLTSQKGVADGYASLNGSTLVPTSQLCSGSASSGYYCDGGTRAWTAVPGSGGGSVTSVFGRTAAVTAQTGDYNTDQVPEGITNLYSTTTRIRNAISGNAPVSYSTSTGIVSMPAATSIADGYLTSANWVTFNAKENALTFNTPLSRSSNTISCLVANGSQAGCLSSTDWTTFNSKEAVITFTAPLSRSVNTVSCVDANGSTKGCLTAADWTTFNSKEAALTFSSPLSRTGNTIACLVASGGQSGCLSSGDWTTFNNKEAALTFSAFFNRSGNTISLASAAANLIVATPDGSAGAPTTRAMVANDVPSLPAAKIGSGQLLSARGGTGADLSAATGLTKVVAGTFTTATANTDYVVPATLQAGTPLSCRSTTGNDTYTCTLSPSLASYNRGMTVNLDPDTANTGTATININGLGAISILKYNGSALSDSDITANRGTVIYYNGTNFNIVGDGGGSGGALTVQGDGTPTGTAYSTINFVSGFGITATPVADGPNSRNNVTLSANTADLNANYLRLNAANSMGSSGTLDMAAAILFRPPTVTDCNATTSGYMQWGTNALRPCIADGTTSNQLAYLKDTPRGVFTVERTSATVATVNGMASATYPSIARVGSTTYSFTSAGTVTLSGSACSGTVLWYIDSSGAITAGHNGLSCTFTGSGVTIANAITVFPYDSIPIATTTISSGAWNTTITDQRSMISAAPKILQGANVNVSYGADSVTISSTGGGGTTVTPNAPYLTIGGTNYLAGVGFAVTVPPTVAGGGWASRNFTGASFTQVGNTIRLAGTTDNNTWRIQGLDISSTTTLVAAISATGLGPQYARCGIGIQRPAGGLAMFQLAWGAILDGTAINADYWSNPTTVTGAIGSNSGAANPSLEFFRVQLTGGNIVGSYSHDGVNWVQIGSVAQSTVLGTSATGTDQWIIGASGNGTNAPTCVLMHWSAT